MNEETFERVSMVVIALLCYAATPLLFQNDAFYSITIGEWIVSHGVDMKDHFSMHDLPYTYPHWAFDVFIYVLYAVGSFTGIYIATVCLAIALGLLLYTINREISGNSIVALFVTVFVIFVLYGGFITARAQLVSYILLLLTVYFIEKYLRTGMLYFPIFLFLIAVVIANTHAAVFPFFFILFLPYICSVVVSTRCSDFYGSKQQVYTARVILSNNYLTKYLAVTAVICLAAGLITPIGNTPYLYLYKTLAGTSLRNIIEHSPMVLILSPKTMIILLAFILIIILLEVKIRLCDLFMLAGLFLMALAHQRHLSLLAVIGAPIFARMFGDYLKKAPETDIYLDKIFLKPKALTVMAVVFTVMFVTMRANFRIFPYNGRITANYNFLIKPTIDETSYPVAACDYIKNNLNLDTVRLFNEYDNGSYLMFRGLPVFVDSRADLYTLPFNGTDDVLQEYFDVTRIRKFYDETFEKYSITHLLIKCASPLTVILARDIRYRELFWDDNFVLYSRNAEPPEETTTTTP
ncbi:MAG: hypothetical protein LBF79_00070 [Dysgonamonadaceae bacterium]|jgi:hypothetical protein|nr:hypothetical protein [Dysgonamonadaceae bacterium]